LVLRTEIVGQDTGDKARTPKFVEKEEFGIGPDIARIRGDKERKISNQAEPSCMGGDLSTSGNPQFLSEPMRLCNSERIWKS